MKRLLVPYNGRDETTAHVATRRGVLAELQALPRSGANPNVFDHGGYAPLYYAAGARFVRVSEWRQPIRVLLRPRANAAPALANRSPIGALLDGGPDSHAHAGGMTPFLLLIRASATADHKSEPGLESGTDRSRLGPDGRRPSHFAMRPYTRKMASSAAVDGRLLGRDTKCRDWLCSDVRLESICLVRSANSRVPF